jgi:hypothetical protein
MGAFKRNSPGIAGILKGPDTEALVARALEKCAAAAQADTDLPIETETYTTDRAAGVIVIAHPAGMAEQAKHGTLTRAAASIGAEVREK